jgi:cell division transport system permease protein
MSVNYVIKEGFAGFKRARLASVTSIIALTIAVLLIGILVRISFNAYKVANNLKNAFNVEVFLNDMNNKQTKDLQKLIAKQKDVEHITYISKDSAAAIFRKQFGSEGAKLADLKFLPASFRIALKNDVPVDDIQKMIKKIKQYDGVDEVSFNQHLLKLLRARVRTLAMAGGGIGFIIILAALLLVFNTIRLTIYAKRNLIKAMKLVGATNGFIRRPFLVEGMFQGILAGIFAIGLLWTLFKFAIPYYLPQIGVLAWPFSKYYYLTGGMWLLAIFMGYFGSRIAARKFIKETTISS